MRELCTRFERASRGGLQSDGVEERVEVVDETLVQAIELMPLLVSESGIRRDGSKEPGGQWGVHALEEFQEDQADAVPVRE